MWFRRLHQTLVAAFLFVRVNETLAQMCSSRENFQHIQEDTAITGSTFLTLKGLGLFGCSKQCLLRSACQSFNYEPSTQECQLNRNSSPTTESGYVVNVVGTIFSDIADWPNRIAGECSTRSCPENSACVEDNNGLSCKVECPNPTLQNGSFTSPISHDVGNILTYACDAGFVSTGNAKCQPDGTWSMFTCILGCSNPPDVVNAKRITPGFAWPTGTLLRYQCQGSLDMIGNVSCLSHGAWTEMKCVARNCSSVLQCNHTYPDGEYWIYPEVLYDKPVKIYCHDMTNGSPFEYLTLPEENYADFSDVSSCPQTRRVTDCESTRFYKLKIDHVDQLMTHRQGLKDLTFINTSTACEVLFFAGTFDCHAKCGEAKTNNFIINTNGSGLKVDPDQQWDSFDPSPILLDPVNISTSDSGRHIKIKCHQGCNYCFPHPPVVLTLAFVYDEEQTVEMTGAVSPVC